MSSKFKFSLEQKIQNPACDEALFEHDFYTIKWITLEHKRVPKTRSLAVVLREGGITLFSRLNDLDLSVQFGNNMSIYPLIAIIEEIRKKVTDNEENFHSYTDCFDSFYKNVKEVERVSRIIVGRQQEEGVVSFHLIPFLFNKGDQIQVKLSDEMQAGMLMAMPTIIHDIRGANIMFSYKFISVVDKPKWCQHEGYIEYYDGAKPITNLPLKPISEEEKIVFETRGKKALELASKPSYKYTKVYKTLKVQPSLFFTLVTAHPIDRPSRIVIDCLNVVKLDDEFNESFQDCFFTRNILEEPTTPEDAMYVLGFLTAYVPSMRTWVIVDVNKVEEIEFSENALRDLVLPEEDKDIIKALVKNAGKGFQDIIQGKSGGSVICLAGEPGTGKTLTAEAIAEYLHKPLITVSSGSLGAAADRIESNLKTELAIAEEWGAVVLIDEADVFMSKRNSNDIVHNGVVSVFLRSLEYYRGVMFLTTNRDDEMDPAFKSRILLTLKYKQFNRQKRAQIWTNLLRNAGVVANGDKLSIFPLNGRQIKNVIRISGELESKSFPNNPKDQTKRLFKVASTVHKDDFSKGIHSKIKAVEDTI